jgi:dTDP-4-amino-4,6-dideoxygalactose transaminase
MTGDRAWATDAGAAAVPVCRPLLPPADDVLPYLREIDASRWYSNFGPLTQRFEERLAEHAGARDAAAVVTACNATAALTATLLALEIPAGTLCMVPAWTFAASGHAIVQAGLVPWFVDVDARDGALHAGAALSALGAAPGALGAVLTVSPFGSPVDTGEWEEFSRTTGIPVVLDAASGFDSVRVSRIPAVVSLHATKVLGVGEGAFVACADTAFVESVRARINFGFVDSREARALALNAKLSEYAAAVGLAGLDAWPATRAAFERVARDYCAAFRAASGVCCQSGYGTDWVSATAIVRVNRLAAVEDRLTAAGIATRRWWGDGLARHQAFAGYPHAPLPATDELAGTTLGLPCSADLSPNAIARIAGLCISAAGDLQPVPSAQQ